MKRIYTAANFNQDDELNSLLYQEQLLTQFWLPEEIALSPDLQAWNTLPQDIKQAYVENLQVLTALDTAQGQMSVNVVGNSLPQEEHLKRAVYNTMAMFEDNIHAKSYSTIYQTYITAQEINDIFNWGDKNTHLQSLLKSIVDEYEALEKATFEKKYLNSNIPDTEYMELQWKAAVSAVFLETYLFYSGFYYPLWFGGQGKLRGAAEIISLIIRDEQVHGLYTGALSQTWYNSFAAEKQAELKDWALTKLDSLYKEHCLLIEEIYDKTGLTADVKTYVRYNANKALMNIGFDTYFPEEEVNPVVLAGINVGASSFDFFSQKGANYSILKNEALSEDDWDV